MSNNFKEELDSVCQLHNEFSRNLKLFENAFHIEPPSTSSNSNTGFFNNDLRYALRASIDLLKNEKITISHSQKSQEALNRLTLAVKILYNDLFDYTIRFMQEYIKELYQNCPIKIVNNHLMSEISLANQLMKKLELKIAESREYRENRSEIYKEMYQIDFNSLLTHYESIIAKATSVRLESEEYHQELNTAKKEVKKLKSIDNLKTMIAIGSFIVAVLALIF